MNKDALGSGENKLEHIVSYLLIGGVIASVCLEVIGIVLYYCTYSNLAVSQDKQFFIFGQDFFTFFAQQLIDLFGAQNAVTFMALGIMVLMLTPFIRAIMSVVYFGWERNWRYVAITLFVLVVLTVSLALH